MDFSNFWWQGVAAPDPGPDAGDPIGQSLRFRGAQRLDRTWGTPTDQNVWTFSLWVKKSENTGDASLLFTDEISQTAGPRFAADQQMFHAGGVDLVASGRLRDPSAWYHLVFIQNGTNLRQYRNGVEVYNDDPTMYRQFNKSGLHSFGVNAGINAQWFEGYMAAAHFIDGQALDPTVFGRYNSKGVWVPVDPGKDGDTAWYGANGFHLDFADPGNVGKDLSGNGNDFTATGFDTQLPGIWSNYLYSSPDPLDVNSTATNVSANRGDSFDGSNMSAANATIIDEWFIFRPATPLTNVTDILIHTSNASAVAVNGVTEWVGDVFNPTDIPVYSGAAITVNSIAVKPKAGAYANVNSYTINGQMLIDSTGTTYDIMQDSPTNNFATLNPIDTGTQTLSDANLKVTGATSTKVHLSTFVLNSGKWYWEVPNITVTNNQYPGIGLFKAPREKTGVTLEPEDLVYYSNGYTYYGSNYLTYGPNLTIGGNGQTVAVAYDFDTNTLYVNNGDIVIGTTPGIVHPNNPTSLRSPAVTTNNNATTINYGQQPFRYTPPAGFEPLSTANMPAANLPATITGTFTGNSNADGPFVYTGCIPARIQYGTIDVKYQDRLGQTNVDFLSNGFKVRSTTSNSGTVTYTVTTTHDGGEYNGHKIPFNSPAPAVSN